MKHAAPVAILAIATSASAQPRFVCTIVPSATCQQQVPGPIVSDLDRPTQNSFGPFTCTQFWGPAVMTASSFASNGIVGVDVENDWDGCSGFGCGPSNILISANARHEFDVVFSSPTSDPIDVRLNLRLSGNIQEDPGLYRRVIISAFGPGGNYTGIFGQIDDPNSPDIRKGLFSTFDEITGSDVSTSTFTNIPVNVPVRFGLSIVVENAAALTTGGAVNFSRGLRLQPTPFTVTSTGPGVSPADIEITSDGANITGGVYGGFVCSPADVADPRGVLDIDDVLTFLAAFSTGDPAADLAAPFGRLDIDDVLTFLAAFSSGCS